MRAVLLASLVLAAFVTPAFATDDPSALLGRFMQAWSASDAKGIAMLFAADADFVNPDGYKATGRDAIEMFYAAAFARGYAGSKGVGEVVSTRVVAPDLVLIDGRWSIDGWHIVALREPTARPTSTCCPPSPSSTGSITLTSHYKLPGGRMRFRIFARACALGAVLTSLALWAQPAYADASEFFGIWVNGSADNSGIARVIVQPGDGVKITIHLFGRCGDKECDWGTQQALVYASDPAANDVRSIAADFNTGYGHKRLTITTAVGRALRFDVQTDFSDGSARSNYATSGSVAYAGDWSSAPQMAAATPPVATPESGTPAPVASAPPPSPPSSGWFGGSSFVGLGPAVPHGYVQAAGEDCRPFDPEQVRVGIVNGDWQLASFSRHLLNFGPHQLAARVAAIVLGFYHFDEQCVVTDTRAVMVYWKRAGQVSRAEMPGQDCVALDPASAKAGQDGDDWHVTAGGNTLLDFGDDKDGAERAVSVIHTYKLNRQCFFARPDSRAQYWLSQ